MYVSGQVSVDQERNLIGAGDVGVQALHGKNGFRGSGRAGSLRPGRLGKSLPQGPPDSARLIMLDRP
jgi:hypothetical protein